MIAQMAPSKTKTQTSVTPSEGINDSDIQKSLKYTAAVNDAEDELGDMITVCTVFPTETNRKLLDKIKRKRRLAMNKKSAFESRVRHKRTIDSLNITIANQKQRITDLEDEVCMLRVMTRHFDIRALDRTVHSQPLHVPERVCEPPADDAQCTQYPFHMMFGPPDAESLSVDNYIDTSAEMIDV